MAKSIENISKDYDVIIWDWNGTLLNDVDTVMQTENTLFQNYGIAPLTREKRDELFCFPIEEYYRKVGFSFEEKSFEVVNQEFMDLYEKLVNEAPLFEGAKEMLQNIASNKSQRQFILSAAPQYHIDQELASRSLRDYFDDAFGLETVKADSKIGRGKELFSKHKLAGAKAIMFGDTRHDQEVADALEIDHHLIADGHQHSDYLKKFSSNVMASRFS